jgi:hypothetical protein
MPSLEAIGKSLVFFHRLSVLFQELVIVFKILLALKRQKLLPYTGIVEINWGGKTLGKT